MYKYFFLIVILTFTLSNCKSNKQFIENSNLIYGNSDVFYENGKTTNLISKKNILILINGKIISEVAMKLINPNDIESLIVIKEKKEIAKYSTGSYESAIIIKLKK